MKTWALAVGLVGAACALWSPQTPADKTYVVFVSGDTDGYLSPCGCTQPMTGGILRRVTAIRQLGAKDRTVVLENGQLVAGLGRQDELKAETLAQTMALAGVTAINLGPSEAKLGAGAVYSISNLSQGKLISGSIERSDTTPVPATVVRGPFLIGGVAMRPHTIARALNEKPSPPEKAVERLIGDAEEAGLQPLLMLQGTHEEAAALARRFPALRLIAYRATGDPPAAVDKIGRTLLVTPGEKAKHLIRLTYNSGEFDSYAPIKLGPEFEDDPDVRRVYRQYLSRVDKEKLLDKLPRTASKAFAGNATCMKCHANAAKVWKGSAHSHALLTLEKEAHGRDPDCAACHVVGLDKKTGFRSRALTPQLANVGCESCHGPGADHARKPKSFPMPKMGQKACAPCHVSSNSPNFDFRAYWRKIAH
jgi:hypothetical protein